MSAAEAELEYDDTGELSGDTLAMDTVTVLQTGGWVSTSAE